MYFIKLQPGIYNFLLKYMMISPIDIPYRYPLMISPIDIPYRYPLMISPEVFQYNLYLNFNNFKKVST